jgi:hypothetical protein
MHARRVAGQHDAERIGPRKEAEHVAPSLAHTLVEDRQIQPARQTQQHIVDPAENAVHLHHVAAHIRPRHPGSC